VKNYGRQIPKLPTADGGIAARQAQRARCTNDDHDVTTVAPDRIVYTFGGRRRPTGERYCRACGVNL
jgi:hypothetical protein